MPRVYLATPTYSEEINTGTARAIWHLATQRDDMEIMALERSGSLIPGSCNVMWCDALNRHEESPLDWFAMLHADIEPQPFWLDILIAEAEQHGADMLSAVVPIKDERGVTSTALASDDESKQFCRITQRQLQHGSFPATFDIDQCADALEQLPDGLCIPSVPRVGLRLNTGCMVLRMKPEFCDGSVFFDNPYWIERYEGQWRARDMSEDWRFSQKVQYAGGKLMATKAVKLAHKGLACFFNHVPWGTKLSDAPAMEAVA